MLAANPSCTSFQFSSATRFGDSIITDAGPYESVLRKGVQVNTRVVSRLRGDKLVGTTTAHYRLHVDKEPPVSGPDCGFPQRQLEFRALTVLLETAFGV